MKELRLQKFLSECGVASRRAAEELILSGHVRVNGQVAKLGMKVDPGHDEIMVDKKLIKPLHKGIILFHKPRGVVSTMSDPEGRPCLTDYLTKPYRSYFPVGRLDWESTGLIVLSNDGELADVLMHPRHGFSRTYHVRVERVLSDKELRRIERGVNLEDGLAKAVVKYIRDDGDTAWYEVVITEGRNRIVRRIMEHLRHPVIKLQRVAHGPFLIGKLKPGEIQKLTESEYLRVRDSILRGKDDRKSTEMEPPRKPMLPKNRTRSRGMDTPRGKRRSSPGR